jgi:hypothetical protein
MYRILPIPYLPKLCEANSRVLLHDPYDQSYYLHLSESLRAVLVLYSENVKEY